MDSVQTLHDFALNLLQDPTALANFGQDPQGALAAAGLGDVSAADVHEVIPLVLDFVPVDHVSSLGGVGQLTDFAQTGTDAGGVQGAIEQLQALTAGLGVPAVSDLPGLPTLPAVPGLGDLGSAVPGLPAVPGLSALPGVNDVTNTAATLASNPTSALSVAGDLSHGLDASPLAGLTGATGAVADPSHVVTDIAGNLSNNLTAPVYDLVDQSSNIAGAGADVADHVSDNVSHLSDNVSHVSDNISHLSDNVGQLTGAVGNLAGTLPHAGGFGGENHGGGHHGGALGQVTSVVGLGNDNNVVTDVTSHVGDVASDSGVSQVHDVVSDVTNIGHNALGNLHIGDIGSGNDVHLHH